MNCKEVVETLDLILDCEATDEQKDRFFEHLDKCDHCLEHYELDRIFREFVARHQHKSCCSEQLLHQIKERISVNP